MAESLPVYSSRNVTITFLGQTLTGLAPDTFVTLSRNSDLTESEVGADGSVSLSVLPDKTGTCTITLQQQSQGNVFLSSVLSVQDESNSIARADFTVADPSGSVLALLTDAHIMTAPEISLGSTAAGSNKEWTIYCEGMKFVSSPEELPGVTAGAAAAASVVATVGTLSEYLV